MRNAGLEEAQAGIKISGRNINNLRYTYDTTLMAESEEELKSLLMKVKEESEKVGLKLNIQTSLSLLTSMHWRRKWQPTPVFLPGESQGRGSLVGCRLWGHTESDTTEATQQQQQQKTKSMASGPITSWPIDVETMETVADFILGGSKITVDGNCSHEIKRRLHLGKKVMTNLDSILKKWRYYFVNKDPSSQGYGFSSSHVWI